MLPKLPFSEQTQKGGRYSTKDPMQYGVWTPRKIAFLTLFVSFPYVAISLLLYILGYRVVAVVLMTVILLVFMIAWFLRISTLKK